MVQVNRYLALPVAHQFVAPGLRKTSQVLKRVCRTDFIQPLHQAFAPDSPMSRLGSPKTRTVFLKLARLEYYIHARAVLSRVINP